jgi:hypothetical protein
MRAMWTGSATRDPESARAVVEECQDAAAKVPMWIWLTFGLGGVALAASIGDWAWVGFFVVAFVGPASYVLWMRRRALAANLPVSEGRLTEEPKPPGT